MAEVTIRYFAGARAAAGVAEEQASAESVAELVRVLSAARGERFARTLAGCSFLVDGLAVRGLETPLTDLATVDVLPPFAGG